MYICTIFKIVLFLILSALALIPTLINVDGADASVNSDGRALIYLRRGLNYI